MFSDQNRNSVVKGACSTYSCGDFVHLPAWFPHSHYSNAMQQCHYKVLRRTKGSSVSEHSVSSAGMSQHKVKSVVIVKLKERNLLTEYMFKSCTSLKFHGNDPKQLC